MKSLSTWSDLDAYGSAARRLLLATLGLLTVILSAIHPASARVAVPPHLAVVAASHSATNVIIDAHRHAVHVTSVGLTYNGTCEQAFRTDFITQVVLHDGSWLNATIDAATVESAIALAIVSLGVSLDALPLIAERGAPIEETLIDDAQAAIAAEDATALSRVDRVGSALTDDPFHRSVSWVVDNPAAQRFSITGGDGVARQLYQLPGEVNGKPGVFEWILDESGSNPVITHQRFIPGGSVTGYPNQVP